MLKLESGQELTIHMIRMFITLYYNVGLLATQLLYILFCHIISRVYASIHFQILTQQPSQFYLKERFETAKILKWKSIFIVMRSQMENIGNFVSRTSPIMLISRVISLSTSMHNALQNVGNSDGNRFENRTRNFTGDYPITPLMAAILAWATIVATLATQLQDIYFAERIYQSVRPHFISVYCKF